jgi:alpha-L-fucosidase
MKYLIFFTACLFISISTLTCQKADLARPSNAQYSWHEQERIMFIHFGMATWQGIEYDNGNFNLNRINPDRLNTDEWCRVAASWGAKQIIFVAKHVGGFCWWPTETTEYCVRNIPWKNGKGDLLKDISESCKKFGIKLGVYCYPGDVRWGAGIGSGGKTKDPSKQEAYNKVYRRQLTELLTLYGEMTEVWFDGSCIISVNDILDKYAPNAVILQGPKASVRWPGTETARLFYPAWNSIKRSDLETGISTQYHDDPDGDAWAPLEADAPLYNHNWFWSPENENKRRSVSELMDIYYKSVGYGGVLLLNSTPDTTGVIPAGDVKLFADFGKEISRRFDTPLGSVKNRKSEVVEIAFDHPREINHTIVMEDYREGHRIREYIIEGYVNNEWKRLASGTSVGRKKIDPFTPVTVTKVRLRILKKTDVPLIRSFEVYNVENYRFEPSLYETADWKECGEWDTKSFTKGRKEMTIDLSPYIRKPGQYEVAFTFSVNVTGMRVDKAEIIFENDNTLQEYITRKDDTNTFYINRTSQVATGSSSVLKVSMSSDNSVFQNKGIIRIRERSKIEL